MEKRINTKSDIAALDEAQLGILERWAFEEKLENDVVCGKLRDEFAALVEPGEVEAWKMVRRHKQRTGTLSELALEAKAKVEAFKTNPENSYEKILGIIGEALFDKMTKGELDLKLETLEDVAKLVISVQGLRLKQDEMALELAKYSDEAEVRGEQTELDRTKKETGVNPNKMKQFRELMKAS